jgi:hypothetical protein
LSFVNSVIFVSSTARLLSPEEALEFNHQIKPAEQVHRMMMKNLFMRGEMSLVGIEVLF